MVFTYVGNNSNILEIKLTKHVYQKLNIENFNNQKLLNTLEMLILTLSNFFIL